eukprot:CAMPEP_0175326702 /NCGR_PEP_ID=MMETSP0093-20121207/74669_1 /TAXON_ID=311494 /ORGANISM="Alexandrium monilatum, Strain CCMP3105" /LENGTH=469 /DNA_ID=CAMNT_0016623715 /DNA_START=33 /DNA_END=1442 /DNA_ORIENTATION=-
MAGPTAPREYIRFELVDFNGALSKTVPGRHRHGKVCIYSGCLGAGGELGGAHVPGGGQGGWLSERYAASRLEDRAGAAMGVPPRAQHIREAGVLCDDERGGQPLAERGAPSHRVREAAAGAEAFGGQGLEVLAGGELEFAMAKPTSSGEDWEPLFSGVDIFVTLQNCKAMDFCYEVERCMEPVGVDILTINAEYGAGQVEITFAPKLGLEAADMVATFRNGVKEMAQQQGLRACFMGKPFSADGPGNGGHFNFSLWAGGDGRPVPLEEADPVLRVSGSRTNVFHSTADVNGLSNTARAFLAGMLAHARAMEAICSPTPSCYGRHGKWAPDVASWGLDDRNAYVRVKASRTGRPTGCYFELRAPSAAANPYLVMAATIAAGLDGLERGLELPTAVQSREGGVPLPANLSEALDALEEDVWLVHKLGPAFVRCFVQVKRGELAAIEERLSATGRSKADVCKAWQHMYMEFI